MLGPDPHHPCLGEAGAALASHDLAPGKAGPHQVTPGKRALFLDRAGTDHVQIELTGK